MSKSEPGYVTLSKGVGFTYGFLFVAVVILAIVMPIVTKKDTKDTVTYVETDEDDWQPIEFDQFVEELDPFTIWGTSDKAKQAFAALDLQGQMGQMSLWDPGLLTGPPIVNDELYQSLPAAGGAGTYINIIRYNTPSGNTESSKIGTKEYQDMATGADKPPILFAFDTIHGYSTIFPINLGLSCTWDPELVKKAAAFAAKEMVAEGVVATFAPMVDVSRDPRWGRIMESSGEDPYLNGIFGAATVEGFQENGVAACVKHIAAYGFAEAGLDYAPTRASTLELHNDFLKAFRYAMMGRSLDASPDKQAWMGMASYHTVGGIPGHANSEILIDTIRGRWGWQGLMVADYAGVSQLVGQRWVDNAADAAREAIGAGVNQNMADAVYWSLAQIPAFTSTVDTTIYRNKTTAEHINLAAKRVIALKDKLGLFDKPIPDAAPDPSVHYSPEALEAARDAAEKSAVLLKNEGNTLPLKAENNKILVVGKIADSTRDILGSWTGIHSKEGYATDALKQHTVTYLQGLETKLGVTASRPGGGEQPESSESSSSNAEEESEESSDISESSDASEPEEQGPEARRRLQDEANSDFVFVEGYAVGYDFTNVGHCSDCEARNEAAFGIMENVLTENSGASAFNTVIAVVGEEGVSIGEATSRTKLTVGGGQMPVIERLAAYKEANPNTKLVLVYNAGRPLTIFYESQIADAILYMWSPGMEGGTATANLLFGDVWPSGHTTTTFPRAVGQVPLHYNSQGSGRPSQVWVGRAPIEEGGGVPNPNFTSDFIDQYTQPIWHFGYGMSYTTFEISDAKVNRASASKTDTITVTATVTSGDHAGKEVADVVQVYLRHPVSQQKQSRIKLVGFQKLTFADGSNTANVEIPINITEHFGFYNPHLDYVVEPGQYYLEVKHHAGEEVEGLSIVIN